METFGPYRVDVLVGQGGMGEVHRAYDTQRERVVALKRLRSDVVRNAEVTERFRREARLTARLSSPHVIPIHDFGEIDGRLFLDMRLVEGRDLGTELSVAGPLPFERAVSIVEQVADALRCAHEAGLVHRDVKPSNVLLTVDGGRDFAYLADFGIARLLGADTQSSLTGTGTAVGTLAYMAPEVFAGQVIDHRVDVYALACVLHELITGLRPFDGDGAQMMYQHLHMPPPDAGAVRAGTPRALVEVLQRGMAKDPARRGATVDEFARAARWALDREPLTRPVPPGPPAAAPPAGLPPRRRVWPVAVVSVLATLAVVAAVGLGVRYLLPTGGDGGPTPTAAAPAASTPAASDVDTGTLRRAFTEITARGTLCRSSRPGPGQEVTSAGRSAEAVVTCDYPELQGQVRYIQWSTPTEATAYVQAIADAQPDHRTPGTWSTGEDGNANEGPLITGANPQGSGYVTVAAYTGRRFAVAAYAATPDQSRTVFEKLPLPPVADLPQ